MNRDYGSGSIVKVKGHRKCWRALAPSGTDSTTGKRSRPLIGYYHTKHEAEAALAAFLASPYCIHESASFAVIFSRWLKRKEATGKSQSTINAYNAAFKRCSRIADIPVKKLKLSDLLQVFEDNSDAGRSTVNNIKIVIDGVFETAERFEYINKNYARLITPEDMLYTKPAEEKHHPFTLPEVRQVITAPRDIVTDCTTILLYTGFRVNELLTMSPDNVFLDDMYFKGGMKTSAGKDRIVPIHHEIQGLVTEYLDKSSGRLFPVSSPKLANAMTERWSHLPHDTRHTFISRLQTLHADRICIERLVGHSTSNVTEKVYTHKDLDELRECIEMLDYTA